MRKGHDQHPLPASPIKGGGDLDQFRDSLSIGWGWRHPLNLLTRRECPAEALQKNAWTFDLWGKDFRPWKIGQTIRWAMGETKNICRKTDGGPTALKPDRAFKAHLS